MVVGKLITAQCSQAKVVDVIFSTKAVSCNRCENDNAASQNCDPFAKDDLGT